MDTIRTSHLLGLDQTSLARRSRLGDHRWICADTALFRVLLRILALSVLWQNIPGFSPLHGEILPLLQAAEVDLGG